VRLNLYSESRSELLNSARQRVYSLLGYRFDPKKIEIFMKRNSKDYNGLTVSICGSYNKHLDQIGESIEQAKKLGVRVIIPKYAERVRATNGFCILRGEKGEPRELQDNNFEAIAMSDFMLVVNPSGYIGPSTSLEIGYAVAKRVPVYCTEKPSEYIFRLYTSWGKSLQEIKEALVDSSTLVAPQVRSVRARKA
jgi:nucleoside 2-deoxyribosyltransferase